MSVKERVKQSSDKFFDSDIGRVLSGLAIVAVIAAGLVKLTEWYKARRDGIVDVESK